MNLAQKYGSERLGYLFAVLSAIMFGSVSVLAKPLVSSVDPILLASFVYIISAITLSFCTKEKEKSYKKRSFADSFYCDLRCGNCT